MLPLMIDMKNKQVVIVGGGKIALRRLRLLKEEGAHLTVVSPQVNDEIKNLAASGKIVWKKKEVCTEDIKQAFLIIAATNDPNINEWIAGQVSGHQLINVVHKAEIGNVQVPKIVKKGKLIFSVSTSGASPLLAKEFSEKFASLIDKDIEKKLEEYHQYREQLKSSNLSEEERKKALKQKLDLDKL
ncbi:precorrin-2 dehydrogenase/sirohydrochlorin ferrochelatase family protein [Metabacillus arenae]|uniref:precorrin-2 dehydrogenase n=1 Tax=Metabacillus arenae TaxID=2771434 RepID=A0A926NEW6_9BACI|nr:NAD(P)-dependent oxidoreductase [Metabacillus arenae]MBD1379976.1 hypothetical protein [Metabacillus arenae]